MDGQNEQPKLVPITKREQLYAVLSAIEALSYDDLVRFGAWDCLDALSSNTLFDSVEGTPDGVFATPKGGFEATATVYVTLQYGGSRDAVEMSDSYPAVVIGRLRNEEAEVEAVSVDTSSSYANEPED